MQMLLITLASIWQEHGRSPSYSGMQPTLVKLRWGCLDPHIFRMKATSNMWHLCVHKSRISLRVNNPFMLLWCGETVEVSNTDFSEALGKYLAFVIVLSCSQSTVRRLSSVVTASGSRKLIIKTYAVEKRFLMAITSAGHQNIGWTKVLQQRWAETAFSTRELPLLPSKSVKRLELIQVRIPWGTLTVPLVKGPSGI